MRMSAAGLGALLALMLLAGCRTLTHPLPPGAPYAERRAQLQALPHFSLKGRVALSANGNGFNANLRWAQDRTRSQLALEGPLGVGGLQITADGESLQMVTSHGDRIADQAAHAELIARLGFDVPIASLRYWVLGVPDPASAADESVDAVQQRLTGLSQDGWQVTYAAYTNAAGEVLPSRLTLERESVRVRLFVEDWQL